MKKIIRRSISALFALAAMTAFADSVVILHTNDTHSNIDGASGGVGGILQRKAIIDSVRKAEKNVILVDAGDMVQGSLYFKFFRGDVEYPLFNMMNYDIRILGNHEFDNGLDELAKRYKDVKATALSANYDFSDTPLAGKFEPYVIKKVNGKKIGFLGLNVNPESLISEENIRGVKFLPIIDTANRIAFELKHKKGCDMVVAVTHIGYDDKDGDGREYDVDLAARSRDIDIIIGGHSHTVVAPDNCEDTPCFVMNASGKPVLIAQTGKYGKNLGYIKIDLDALEKKAAEKYDYRLIPVTDRFSQDKLDKRMAEFIVPFRASIDSVNNYVIAKSTMSMRNDDRNGALANFTADMAFDYGRMISDSLRKSGEDISVDLAVMNVGGIRQDMNRGDVTEGHILSTFPFSNHFVITKQRGADIIDALAVAAKKGGEAVSRNVRVVCNEDGSVRHVVINGEKMNPGAYYNMITIDYVAEGNDGLTPFSNGKILWRDSREMSLPAIEYVKKLTELGLPISPDPTGRFVKNE